MAIKLVGVELEGGWNTDHKPKGFRPDGSVSFGGENYPVWAGEVASKPMRKTEIGAWISGAYPEESNRSCGCHVHMSFEGKMEYARLMTEAQGLELDLLTRLEAWGHTKNIHRESSFWSRIVGANNYCRLGGDPDTQAQADYKCDARYRVLNFCHKLHGTLECRVLPMFKRPEFTVQAVELVIETVDMFLLRMDKEVQKHIVVETVLGPIVCKAWKQGYTATLIASPAVKRAALELIFSRSPREHYKKQLQCKILTHEHVQVEVGTREGIKQQLQKIKFLFDNHVNVSVERRRF